MTSSFFENALKNKMDSKRKFDYDSAPQESESTTSTDGRKPTSFSSALKLLTDSLDPSTTTMTEKAPVKNPSVSVVTSTPSGKLSARALGLAKSRPRTSLPNKVKKPSAKGSKNGGNSSSTISKCDVPTGFLPPAFKNCHLSNVLLSARRCLDHLREVREALSNIVGEDAQLSKGMKKLNPDPSMQNLSKVAEILTILTREAFPSAHRLNQTTVALYNAEDMLRFPSDIRTFEIVGNGRIRLPDPSFNDVTLEKIRAIVDKSADYYNKFDQKGENGAELQDILFSLMRSFQDMHTLALGCQEVFQVLLYLSPRDKLHLQQYLLSLEIMERSDMLTEVQDLRRVVDELVIFLEKLSWGSFVIYRLASGRNPNSNYNFLQDVSAIKPGEKKSNSEKSKNSSKGNNKWSIKESSEETSFPSKEKFTSSKQLDRDYIFGTNFAANSTAAQILPEPKITRKKKSSKVSVKASVKKANSHMDM